MYLTIFGKPRYLGLVEAENETRFEKGERLLVESSRGVEIAVVTGEITERQEALYRSIDNRQEGQPANDSGLQNVSYIRVAEQEDFDREQANREDEDNVLVTARQVLSRHTLDMKLVDVEYMNDRKKLFLYFTSEQRVDFRAYVRDLAREFKTRIELRQIGVRDESKVVKGIGACGRVCCCSYWLQRFMPIGIKMVKEQNLALNPTKISGLCGRLMCCMSFEQDTYHELWKNLPSHGAKIKTEQGTWILTGVNLATRSCSLHGPNGTVNIPVGFYQKFKETVLAGKVWSNEENGLDEDGRLLNRESLQTDQMSECVECACSLDKKFYDYQNLPNTEKKKSVKYARGGQNSSRYPRSKRRESIADNQSVRNRYDSKNGHLQDMALPSQGNAILSRKAMNKNVAGRNNEEQNYSESSQGEPHSHRSQPRRARSNERHLPQSPTENKQFSEKEQN